MVPRMPRPLTMATTALAAALGVAGCAALVVPVPIEELIAPVRSAASTDPVELERMALAGEPHAQLALSIVLAHGLSGRATDTIGAEHWRRRALSAATTVPITQYTAAFNGQPSRVNIINVRQAAIMPAQLAAIDRCVALLAGQGEDPRACGSGVDADALRQDWKLSPRSSTVLGPAGPAKSPAD